MRKGVFICGTDTEVGKTVISCCLLKLLKLRGIDCGVMKPVQCAGDDAQQLIKSSGARDPLDWVNPYFSRYPYAPYIAFKKEKIQFNKYKLIDRFKKLSARHKFMVVEGAGGLVVPITKRYFIADLILDLKLPIIIVSHSKLGTINHTLLAVEYARSKRIKIAGIIFNNLFRTYGIPEKTNPQIIARISKVPVLGIVPYMANAQTRLYVKQLNKIKLDLDKIINDLR